MPQQKETQKMGTFLLWHIRGMLFEQRAPEGEIEMSKNDRLGPIVRALVGVDLEYHNTLIEVANRLNSSEAPAWNKLYADVSKVGLSKEKLVELPPLLTFDNEHIASVALNTRHDSVAFWHDTSETPARYVWPGFMTHVVAKAKPSEPSGIVKIPYAPLSRSTKVCDLLKTPGVGNFDPSKLSAIIAAMLAKQPNGESGDLLNDGCANLFPCGPVLALVFWRDDYRRWGVDGWDPGDGVDAGRRVFSGNLKP